MHGDMNVKLAWTVWEEMWHFGHGTQVRGLDIDMELLAVQECGKSYTWIDVMVPFVSPSLSSVITVLLKLKVLEELNFIMGRRVFTGEQMLQSDFLIRTSPYPTANEETCWHSVWIFVMIEKQCNC